MDMLCLIRFVPLAHDRLIMWEAVEHYAAAAANMQGRQIHRKGSQLMTLFKSPNDALTLLSETLDAGETEGFAISAGLAQGIQSRATLASSLAGFTEGTMETLLELTSAATLQEVAISGKLSSIIKLAAPAYWDRFEAIRPPANLRLRSLFVMTPQSHPDAHLRPLPVRECVSGA